MEYITIMDSFEKKSRDELHEVAKGHFLKVVKIDDEETFKRQFASISDSDETETPILNLIW